MVAPTHSFALCLQIGLPHLFYTDCVTACTIDVAIIRVCDGCRANLAYEYVVNCLAIRNTILTGWYKIVAVFTKVVVHNFYEFFIR